MPSAPASTRTSRCGQGAIVQSPDTRPSYGEGRTEAVSPTPRRSFHAHMYRARFIAVYAVLALLVAGSAYGAFRGAHLRGLAHSVVADRCEAPKTGGDPVLTAVVFIHTAVERTNPRAGFALTTPAFRRSTTCADWAREAARQGVPPGGLEQIPVRRRGARRGPGRAEGAARVLEAPRRGARPVPARAPPARRRVARRLLGLERRRGLTTPGRPDRNTAQRGRVRALDVSKEDP